MLPKGLGTEPTMYHPETIRTERRKSLTEAQAMTPNVTKVYKGTDVSQWVRATEF